MEKKTEKICDAAPKYIFSCSGAADVGHISDLAARQLTKAGAGSMFCLAGIGGNVESIIAKTKATQPRVNQTRLALRFSLGEGAANNPY